MQTEYPRIRRHIILDQIEEKSDFLAKIPAKETSLVAEKWEVVHQVPGGVLAETLRGLLEAQDIRVYLAQEGAARAIGLSLTPMGEVSIMVPSSQVSLAKRVLDDYYAGKFEEDS